jgi:hypothetical protein
MMPDIIIVDALVGDTTVGDGPSERGEPLFSGLGAACSMSGGAIHIVNLSVPPGLEQVRTRR